MPFGTVKLNDGYEIPAIAFGSGSALRGKHATEYVAQALEAGFSHVDTAQVYQNEDSVGEAIRESGLARSELYVTTKYWFGTIHETVSESLAKLGLKYVDLYLIHNPAPVQHRLVEAWKEFEDIKDAGSAKSIGVSNFNLEQLQTIVKVARIKPAVNQIQFHPYNYLEHKKLLKYCEKHGIIVEAYGSLAPLTQYPGGPVDAALDAAAERRGVTRGQIIFAWVRAKGVIIVTTSSNKQHLQEYLEAADIIPLTDMEIADIDKAGAKGPPGDSYVLAVTLCLILFVLFVLGLFDKVNFRNMRWEISSWWSNIPQWATC